MGQEVRDGRGIRIGNGENSRGMERMKIILLRLFWLASIWAMGRTVVAAEAELAEPVVQRDSVGRVSLKAPGAGAVVRYVLDSSAPTRSWGAWLAPVEVPAGYTLQAATFSPDGSAHGKIVSVAGPAQGPRLASTLVPLTQNRDWKNYDWAERHAACVSLMKERQPEIVMLGDSITHFWGGDPAGNPRRAPEIWDRLFAGKRVVNLGFGWDRTENVLWRLTHGEWENVRPKVVGLMIGTNNMGINTVDEIVAGIEAICAEIHRRSPSTRILLQAIFPRGEKPNATREKVTAVNQRLAQLHGRNQITFVDFGARFLEPDGSIAKEVMSDFLHPTAKGYALWADAIAPTLHALLAQP
jgi:lysophospholipase L1-like esterase